MKGRNEGDKLVKQFSKITPELNYKTASTFMALYIAQFTYYTLPLVNSIQIREHSFRRRHFLRGRGHKLVKFADVSSKKLNTGGVKIV